MQPELAQRELRKITTRLLSKLDQKFDLTPIFQLLEGNLHQKVSIFVWLNTSKIIDQIFALALKNTQLFISSDAPFLIALINFHFNDYFDAIASPQVRNCSMKLNQNEKVRIKLEKMGQKVKEKEEEEDSQIKRILLSLVRNEKEKNQQQIRKLTEEVIRYPIKGDIFDEITCNWLKWRISQSQNFLLCCQCTFFKADPVDVKKQYIECKKYTNIHNLNNNILNHIKRTIIGFLNTGGGMLIIGIDQKKQRFSVEGVKIKESERKDVVKTFSQKIIPDIYPKHAQFMLKQLQTELNFQVKLNDYIELEFHPITVLDRHEQLQQLQHTNLVDENNNTSFIIKVMVRTGHPIHFYHLINAEKSLQFFQRNKSTTEKVEFPQAYPIIYQKLKVFQEAGDDPELKKALKGKFPHEECRFDGETTVDFDEQFDLQL